MKTKIAMALAALMVSQGAFAQVTENTTLKAAVVAIGDAYDAFSASDTAKASTLGYVQNLIENVSTHGTYDRTDVSITFQSGVLSYDMDVITHDNTTAISTAQTNLQNQIKTDFFGGNSNGLSNVSLVKSSGTWDLTAGSVVTTWGDTTTGIVTELNDLESAITSAADAGFSSASLTSLNTAVAALDDSVDVFNDGFDELNNDTDSAVAVMDDTSSYANWGMGRRAGTIDISGQGDNFSISLNGTEETDDVVDFNYSDVENDSSFTIGTGGNAVDHSSLDDYICDLFNDNTMGTGC